MCSCCKYLAEFEEFDERVISISRFIKVKLLEDFDWNVNDRKYNKGEEFEVVEFDYKKGYISKNYARYYDNTLDWIPKDISEVIEVTNGYE